MSNFPFVYHRPELVVKKLRYYARFIVVCLLLNKMDVVKDLVKVSILQNNEISNYIWIILVFKNRFKVKITFDISKSLQHSKYGDF